jgi:hypothetical protein
MGRLVRAPQATGITAGCLVALKEDPLASGLMLVIEDKGGGWLVCESLHVKDPTGGYRRDMLHQDELSLERLPQVTQTGLPGKP